MRSINVDIDVFAAIWHLRAVGEVDENQILRRVLLDKAQHDQIDDLKEVKTSDCTGDVSVRFAKIRWVDDVRQAILDLGGEASLTSIYERVEKMRSAGGRSVPRTLDAVIRRTLEDHSSDSDNFRGIDIFRLIGRGRWGVR